VLVGRLGPGLALDRVHRLVTVHVFAVEEAVGQCSHLRGVLRCRRHVGRGGEPHRSVAQIDRPLAQVLGSHLDVLRVLLDVRRRVRLLR
jgi:hypothetical protein